MADRDYSKVGNPADLAGDGTAHASFLDNLEESAKNFGGNLVSAFTSPVQTLHSIDDVVDGYLAKIPGIHTGERQTAMADAMTKHFKDRYGSVDGIKKTAYEDPVGFAADLSSVIAPFSGAAGLAGKVADAAGLAKTASVLGKVGEVGGAMAEASNPLNIVKGAAKGAAKVAELGGAAPETVAAISNPGATASTNLARKLYGAALNPRGATRTEISKLADTGLREGVGPADEAGVWDKIMGHAKTVQDMVDKGDAQGLTLDPAATRTAVAGKLLPSAAAGGEPGESFGVQATPSADRGRVQAGLDDWTNEHFIPANPGTPGTPNLVQPPSGPTLMSGGTPATPEQPIPIPIGEGNDIKSGTYRQLSKKAFGKSAAGATEPVPVASEQTQLEIARDLRRQIGDQLDQAGIGDVHGANAAEGDLLDLQPHIERNAANDAKASLFKQATKGALVNHALPRVAMTLYKAGKIDQPTLNYIMKQAATGSSVQEGAENGQ